MLPFAKGRIGIFYLLFAFDVRHKRTLAPIALLEFEENKAIFRRNKENLN
jgi:hypothetical protein